MSPGGERIDELDKLLAAARSAGRERRIEYRDAIAEHGARAARAIREWLPDPELGAFAVRVLEKIAQRPDDRPAAINALKSIDASATSEIVARDASDALGRLGHRESGYRGKPSKAQMAWSGYASASSLEQRFHDDMVGIFQRAGEATRKERPDGSVVRGYWASYFLRGVRNHGGVAYAHQLLRADGTTDGFKRLTEEGRLDLTMEALVLRPEYAALFSETERQVAASRLARAGYEPGR
jgi:hypothetical protein